MDDLLRDFVTETNESLDVVDVELVRFEQDPNNAKILDNVFRLVHTIKGTYGFLGLPRLEALAHAAEALMGKFRDGVPATSESVTLILATIDRIKAILGSLENEQREPEDSDDDLIGDLERLTEHVGALPSVHDYTVGTLTPQVLERPLRPGEDTLDDLERAFRETDVDPPKLKTERSDKSVPAEGAATDDSGRSGSQSIRVNVDTLERLMTTVSELVGELKAIGVDTRGESYGLLIDNIGEVLKLGAATREPNPLNLEPTLARVSVGIHRLEGELLVVLDIDRVLDVGVGAIAA